MSKFIDPKNPQEIMSSISKLKEPSEIQKYIEDIYPGWIILSLDRYSTDYPHLQQNWERICEEFSSKQKRKINPQKIVLVQDILFDDKHSLIRFFCEYLSSLGYVVRRATEFVACEKCFSAIPIQELWFLLKEKNFKVPPVWKDRCLNC